MNEMTAKHRGDVDMDATYFKLGLEKMIRLARREDNFAHARYLAVSDGIHFDFGREQDESPFGDYDVAFRVRPGIFRYPPDGDGGDSDVDFDPDDYLPRSLWSVNRLYRILNFAVDAIEWLGVTDRAVVTALALSSRVEYGNYWFPSSDWGCSRNEINHDYYGISRFEATLVSTGNLEVADQCRLASSMPIGIGGLIDDMSTLQLNGSWDNEHERTKTALSLFFRYENINEVPIVIKPATPTTIGDLRMTGAVCYGLPDEIDIVVCKQGDMGGVFIDDGTDTVALSDLIEILYELYSNHGGTDYTVTYTDYALAKFDNNRIGVGVDLVLELVQVRKMELLVTKERIDAFRLRVLAAVLKAYDRYGETNPL